MSSASATMEMQRSLGRIEGKVDALLMSFSEHVKDDAGNFKELKIRTAITEKKIYVFMGAYTVLVGLAPFVIGHFFK